AQEKREFLTPSRQATTQPVWRLGIPALKALDLAEDSSVPSAGALAATWDPDLVEREARVVAAGAVAANRRQIIGPDVADFGDDPWLASRMAVAWVTGLQGDGVIATLEGMGRGDERSFTPYEAAVEEAGLWAIQLAAGAPRPLAGVLENDWGFKGFVMGAGAARDEDEEVRRRLRAMFGVGLFDEDTRPGADPVVDFNESVVLLKNESSLLPLAPVVRSIAVIGGSSLAIPAESHAAVSYGSAGDAVALARKAEIALVFGGDLALIQAVAKVNPRTIVCLDRPKAVDGVPAILVAWGRRDIGRFLFGQNDPSGKLPVGVEPQFPFGTGLSYTSFVYSELQVFPKAPRYGQLIQTNLRVKNSGARAGAEVVELYVGGKLKAFQRIDLKPGEARLVSFELDRRATSFYDPLVKTWACQPGVFEVTVGSSSRDIRLRDSFELFR
ncbi:MAG: fibronectin type III-like domain-contianing protein, partial [Acidobacteriota bacterium]|nr:fibronectin type III-like domain-contianing protein [Acidobacteriota bacterium]